MELFISQASIPADDTYVSDKIRDFNWSHLPDSLKGKYQEIHLLLKNAEGVNYGGLTGEICWNWLEVRYLFVEESCRKTGYGSLLIAEAEQLARSKGCDFIKLDTLSFQALDFYLKHGFVVYGTLPNA
ncbi:GNAT family N-acetyltransferase [Paenibacillus sp. sgz5001063]|uniref:GNAT family N-acetyltransferase n=1 Tax=Paenibacillus sp. sgz5001063 TaxID=3242474 RepID=UPI0036D3E0F7